MAALLRRHTQLPPGSEENSERQDLTSLADDTDANSRKLSWRQFLFDDARLQADEQSLRTDLFCSLVLLACWITVFIVVTVFMVRNWPSEAKVYSSMHVSDVIRGLQEGYTCDCSLPLNLQGLHTESKSKNSSLQRNLNQCYRRSSLETIAVLQYPKNYTEFDAKVRVVVNANEVHHVESNKGYVVSQEVIEITVSNDQDQGLKPIYRNGAFENATDDILFPPDYIQSAVFMTFPLSYLRLAFSYDCLNCSLCSLEVMNDHISFVTGRTEPSWGLCYYWDRLDQDQCNRSNGWSYTGKCVLYPTNTLPFPFAIKKFVERVQILVSQKLITGIAPVSPDRGSWANYTSVQPNVFFMNKSTVTNSSLPYGFVEFPPESALHASLVTIYPGIETECSKMPDLQSDHDMTVCNASSICNAFARSDVSRTMEFKCLHMTNASQCAEIVESASITIDNNFGDSVGVDKICRSQSFGCLPDVSPYEVFRYVKSSTSSVDPNATYLNGTTSPLQDEWMLRSGICTNTYANVYRYNKTWFLEAQCINGTDLCTLSGRYYKIDDFHDALPDERQLPSEMYNNYTLDGELFVCYLVTEKRFSLWFLDYINVLFSWLGVLLLIYVSGIYKLYRFLRAKYARKEDRPAAVNWCAELVPSPISWCAAILLKITCSIPKPEVAATPATIATARFQPKFQRWRKALHVAAFVGSLQYRRMRRVRKQRAAESDEAEDRLYDGLPSVQL